MVRPEVLERNPHLLAATGGLALRLHPDDAVRRNLADGDHVTLTVAGVARRLVVRPDAGVPVGLATLPATPDEPIGSAQIDWATLTVERRALEVA
jgi:hypothetical protein